MTENECLCCRTKRRTPEEKRKLMNSLSRIEGQVRGLKSMIESDAYCPDVLIQSSAVSAAMNAFNRELLACHIKSCVVTDIKEGKLSTVDELVALLLKFMK